MEGDHIHLLVKKSYGRCGNHISTPVVILTHFDRFREEANYVTLDEVKSELKDQFKNYFGTVQFKGNIDEWKSNLAILIGEIIGVKANS